MFFRVVYSQILKQSSIVGYLQNLLHHYQSRPVNYVKFIFNGGVVSWTTYAYLRLIVASDRQPKNA